MGREDTIQFLRGTEEDLAAENPLLKDGEPCKEMDTGRYKLGPGRWNDLDYYIPSAEIQQMIDAAIAAIPPGGTVDLTALTAHINSPTPHPVYDSGPSLAGRYRNAKARTL